MGRGFRLGLLMAVAALLAVAISSAADAQGPSGGATSIPNPVPSLEMARQQTLLQRLHDRLASAPERSVRAKSRTRFAGLGREQAVAAAVQAFEPDLTTPVEGGLRLSPGEKLKTYLNDYLAKVTSDDAPGAALIRSALPLRAPDESGDKKPVDLSLVRDGDHLESLNPIAPVHFGEHAGDALSFPESGVTLTPVGDGSVPADSPSDDRVFYPRVGTDTDFVTQPSQTGAESSWVIRSAQAAEAFQLKVGLPTGARLRYAALSGGLEDAPLRAQPIQVVKGAQVLGDLQPPSAKDADGQAVPTMMDFEGDIVTIRIAHRSADAKYPIMLDPVYDDYMRWTTTGSGTGNQAYDPTIGYAGWLYAQGGYQGTMRFCAGCNYDWHGGLYLWGDSGNTFSADRFNEWYYQAPGDAYIFRADFGWVHHVPAAIWNSYGQTGASAVTEGIWSRTRNTWENARVDTPSGTGSYAPYWVTTGPVSDSNGFHTHCQQPCVWGTPSSPAGTPGNMMAIGLGFTGQGTATSQPIVYMGGAQVGLHEFNPPVLAGPISQSRTDANGSTSAGSPSGWVKDGSLTTTVPVKDTGLGLSSANVSSSLGWSTSSNLAGTCTATLSHNTPCQQGPLSPAFVYNVANMPEGANHMTANATDIVNNSSQLGSAWDVKVDHSSPTVTASGSLRDHDGRWVEDGSYSIPVTATDRFSGVQSLTLAVDGNQVGNPLTASSQQDGAPLSGSFSLDTTPFKYGPHTITVTAKDWAGNPASTDEWTILADGHETSFQFDSGVTLNDITHVDNATDEVLEVKEASPSGMDGSYQPNGDPWSSAIGEARSDFQDSFGAGAEPQVTGLVLAGDVPTAALGPQLAAHVTNRSVVTQFEAGKPDDDGAADPAEGVPYLDDLFNADIAAEQQALDPRDSDPDAQGSAAARRFSPAYGGIRTRDAGGSSSSRVIQQTMTWASQNDIDDFANDDAYEHDLKLINPSINTTKRHPTCGSYDSQFWALRPKNKHFSVFWSNSLDAAAPYFDTDASDYCSTQDFTIGLYKPQKLKPRVKYSMLIVARRGDDDHSAYQLEAQKPKKVCEGNPYCVNTIKTSSARGTLISQGTGRAPEYRRWRKGRSSRPG